MKVLIIGAKGQLGTTLTRTIPSPLVSVSLDLPEFDITDTRSVQNMVEKERPDVIVNASAYTDVDRSEEEADPAYLVNATGPGNLALAAGQTGCRVIHVSTDYVFDGTACTPYSPDAPCTPIGVYGQSKRRGEINISKTIDNFVIIRTSWLYSQYGNNFVLTMLRLMNERDEIKVVADQVGSPTWATTLSTAIWAVVRKTSLRGVYHWSDAGVTSWYDFAVAIQEEGIQLGLIDREIPIHPITTAEFPTTTKRPPYSALSCQKSWYDLEVNPVQWRVALRKMMMEKKQASK